MNTTPEQEQKMRSQIMKFQKIPLPDVKKQPVKAYGDTCATRTQIALEAGGITSNFLPMISPFPSDTARLAILNGGIPILIPKNGSMPENLSSFDK